MDQIAKRQLARVTAVVPAESGVARLLLSLGDHRSTSITIGWFEKDLGADYEIWKKAAIASCGVPVGEKGALKGRLIVLEGFEGIIEAPAQVVDGIPVQRSGPGKLYNLVRPSPKLGEFGAPLPAVPRVKLSLVSEDGQSLVPVTDVLALASAT